MIRDYSAFGLVEPSPQPEGMVFDCDGLPVPDLWRNSIARWEKLAKVVRQKQSAAYVDRRLSAAPPKPAREPRTFATRFSTDYAVKWGRRQKNAAGKPWVLIEREHYDFRTKRHHDLQLGVDAMFDDGDGLIGIQGAGRHERTPHYQRFIDRGGPEKASRRRIRIVYLEFTRGQHAPVVEEWWTPKEWPGA